MKKFVSLVLLAFIGQAVQAASDEANYLSIDPFYIEPGEVVTVNLNLINSDNICAYQTNLVLPEGLSVNVKKAGTIVLESGISALGDRTYGYVLHEVLSTEQADGSMLILCYSDQNACFTGNEGAVATISIIADESVPAGVYDVKLKNSEVTYESKDWYNPKEYLSSAIVGVTSGECLTLAGAYNEEAIAVLNEALAGKSGINVIDMKGVTNFDDKVNVDANPNTLIYTSSEIGVANEKNVVVDGTCDNLVLTDSYAFSAPTSFSASSAGYERELVEGKYGTIVLPFAANTDDYVFYVLTTATDNMLTFDEVENPVANTPYLYKLRDGKSATQITNNEVAVSSELTPTGTAAWQMIGSFTNQTIATSEDTDTYYYVYTSSDNQVHQVTNTLTVKPYRAYFTTSSTNGTQLAIRTRSGEETLIEASEVDGLHPEVYYDLSGRRVENPVKGIYIVNGKKVEF